MGFVGVVTVDGAGGVRWGDEQDFGPVVAMWRVRGFRHYM